MSGTFNKIRKDQINRCFKLILIIELVVSYMALLNLISHMRDAEKYEIDKEHPILLTDDFQQFAGTPGKTTDGLQIDNPNYGEIIGFEGEISLLQFENITASFMVDCPTDLGVGSILFVDLYDFETGYDFTEQEHQVTIEKGIKAYELDFYRGAVFPPLGELRFFTAGPGAYSIKDIQVYPRILLPKISSGMIAGAVICLALTAVTCVAWFALTKRRCSGGRSFGGNALEK